MLLGDIHQGLRLRGVRPDGPVEVVAIMLHGANSGRLIYKTVNSELEERLVSTAEAQNFTIASESGWTFEADGNLFRLASEARRIKQAHLFDPYSGVDSSGIEPLPHQIQAVYELLLPNQPLSFLLADDPGAGKTIMSGLYIRELLLRGALVRCLIIAPGSLVEQWQEELWDKFSLHFDIFSRDMVEASRAGNPFLERNLLIARLDQLSRNENLLNKLDQVDMWDLVIVDEAHKMAAHYYGSKLERTKRYQLGEKLRHRAHNLLLLTATPHNGKDEDYLAFLRLLDPARFAGRLRKNGRLPNHEDIMRRTVKENLLTFAGTPLFPERKAYSLKYDLSDSEQALYEAVTEYVRDGMNKAQALEEAGERRGFVIGFALVGLQRRLASSPAALYKSLRRRREKLEKRLKEMLNPYRETESSTQTRWAFPSDWDDFDPDDYDEEELERLEEQSTTTAADMATPEDLQTEIAWLQDLEKQAWNVQQSGKDRKWEEMSRFLQSDNFRGGDPPRKLLVFTEHKDTLHYLTEKIRTLLGHPQAVVNIHGGIKREDRRRVQDQFRNDPTVRVMVATDAAGEGVNLQRANLMVNYDLPWNPNRIEQRFGRIHRIGQTKTCHLWNLVAHQTREGEVFVRLLDKIEAQRKALGDQIYDVLGDSEINKSLQKALISAIQYSDNPARLAKMNVVLDGEIGERTKELVEERALAAESLKGEDLEKIRKEMAQARTRKVSPGFVSAFFQAGMDDVGGRIARREPGRFEITRVPLEMRSETRLAQLTGPVNDRYERVTFDPALMEGKDGKPRAELIAPGHPLLASLIKTIVEKHGPTLKYGATLVDETDWSDQPRVLIFLDHTISDGRLNQIGQRTVVSQRFQFVEVDKSGQVTDPGADPYLNYRALTEDEQEEAAQIDHSWADTQVETIATNWAIENLVEPHLKVTRTLIEARVSKVRQAVQERLTAEIQFWDSKTVEYKEKELHGKKPPHSSGHASRQAEEMSGRLKNRMQELDAEEDLINKPPEVMAAALILPIGLLTELNGKPKTPLAPGDTDESDRRAIAAVMKAERDLGRQPEEQEHNNPGFDILSLAPSNETFYIEVKGYKPTTPEIKVSRVQVLQGQHHPEFFRLAVVEVPEDPKAEPIVRYLIRPFDGYDLHFAQTSLPLKVADLIAHAVGPQ